VRSADDHSSVSGHLLCFRVSIVSATGFYSTDTIMTSAFVVPLSAGCDPLYPIGSSLSPSVPTSLRLPTACLACHRAVCWVRCSLRCTSHQSATLSRRTACLIINTPTTRSYTWPFDPVRTRPLKHCQCASTMSLAGSWRKGLLLNPHKTEAVLFGTLAQRKKIPTAGGIDVTGAVVPFCDTVKLLGVTLDSALSMDRHVTEVVRSCSYHTRALRHIRPLLTLDVAKSVGHSIVASRLDYANTLLHQHPPQAAGCSELFGQSGLSDPALCQCHRVTSTAPLASSPAKNQLQACRRHLQDQLNQDFGLPV